MQPFFFHDKKKHNTVNKKSEQFLYATDFHRRNSSIFFLKLAKTHYLLFCFLQIYYFRIHDFFNIYLLM